MKTLREASKLFFALSTHSEAQQELIHSVQTLVQLLDIAREDEITVSHLNNTLFSMASNVAMLSRILEFVSSQRDTSVTTKRWVITMLAMLSSENEWLKGTFIMDESAHNYDINTNYTRELSVPLATKLHITWDQRTKTEKGKDCITVTGKQFRLKLSGSFSDFYHLQIDGYSAQCNLLPFQELLNGDINCL
jgi:hypothetical protein